MTKPLSNFLKAPAPNSDYVAVPVVNAESEAHAADSNIVHTETEYIAADAAVLYAEPMMTTPLSVKSVPVEPVVVRPETARAGRPEAAANQTAEESVPLHAETAAREQEKNDAYAPVNHMVATAKIAAAKSLAVAFKPAMNVKPSVFIKQEKEAFEQAGESETAAAAFAGTAVAAEENEAVAAMEAAAESAETAVTARIETEAEEVSAATQIVAEPAPVAAEISAESAALETAGTVVSTEEIAAAEITAEAEVAPAAAKTVVETEEISVAAETASEEEAVPAAAAVAAESEAAVDAPVAAKETIAPVTEESEEIGAAHAYEPVTHIVATARIASAKSLATGFKPATNVKPSFMKQQPQAEKASESAAEKAAEKEIAAPQPVAEAVAADNAELAEKQAEPMADVSAESGKAEYAAAVATEDAVQTASEAIDTQDEAKPSAAQIVVAAADVSVGNEKAEFAPAAKEDAVQTASEAIDTQDEAKPSTAQIVVAAADVSVENEKAEFAPAAKEDAVQTASEVIDIQDETKPSTAQTVVAADAQDAARPSPARNIDEILSALRSSSIKAAEQAKAAERKAGLYPESVAPAAAAAAKAIKGKAAAFKSAVKPLRAAISALPAVAAAGRFWQNKPVRWSILGVLLPVSGMVAAYAVNDPKPEQDLYRAERVMEELPPVYVESGIVNGSYWAQEAVQPGDSLTDILSRVGMSDDNIRQVLAHSSIDRDLIQLRAGQSVNVRFDASGDITDVQFFNDDDNGFRDLVAIEKVNGKWGASTSAIDMETMPTLRAVQVRTSARGALAQAGVPVEIRESLNEIFSDAVKVEELGEGDSIRLLYNSLYFRGQEMATGDILAAEVVKGGKTYQAYYYSQGKGDEESGSYYDQHGKALHLAEGFNIKPVEYTRISSPYGTRVHPVLHTVKMHTGIDYAAPTGTPIRAAADGVLTFKGWKGGYGNTVVLMHSNGIETLYAHMSAFSPVQGKVKAGDVIGYVGSTGRSTGPHLHYEVRKNGQHMNPTAIALPTPKLTPSNIAEFHKIQAEHSATLAAVRNLPVSVTQLD